MDGVLQVRSSAVDLIVVDSVAALVPRAEIQGEMGDHHMALQARLMGQVRSHRCPARARGGNQRPRRRCGSSPRACRRAIP